MILSGIDGQCKFTNDKGPQKRAPCIFPFRLKFATYLSCTNAFDPDGLFW